MSKPKKSKGVPVWVFVLPAVIFLPLIGLRIAYFSFKNPSGSMIPTLLTGDLFMVRRGFSLPPRRGEVIAFRFPENREQDFVKRLIAVPGDTLEAIDGRPVINGWLAPHCYVGPFPQENHTSELYVEYLGDYAFGTVFDRKLEERACKVDTECGAGQACRGSVCGMLQGPYKVASNEVWVMGDNRNNSHDSRSWRGGLGAGVPFDDVHGRGQIVWMRAKSGLASIAIDGPPVLPPEAASLQPALDKCLRDRPPPAATTPPAH